MSVSVLFLLSSLGLAITSQGQQCSKPFGGANMHLGNSFITQETFADGAVVSFECDVGYNLAGGSRQVQCSSGKWSSVELKCERTNCGPLDVAHGIIDYKDSTLFGDTAKVICETGYILVGQSGVIRCEAQGWTGRTPTCEVVKCFTPADVVNGRFDPWKEDYEYKEVVSYTCNKDFTLNGSDPLTCASDSKFHPAPPTCVKVECKDPQIENANWVSGSRPPHRHKATVTYVCKTGYKMFGQSSLTCEINSQWSSKLPECLSKGNAVVGGLIGEFVTILALLVQTYWM